MSAGNILQRLTDLTSRHGSTASTSRNQRRIGCTLGRVMDHQPVRASACRLMAFVTQRKLANVIASNISVVCRSHQTAASHHVPTRHGRATRTIRLHRADALCFVLVDLPHKQPMIATLPTNRATKIWVTTTGAYRQLSVVSFLTDSVTPATRWRPRRFPSSGRFHRELSGVRAPQTL